MIQLQHREGRIPRGPKDIERLGENIVINETSVDGKDTHQKNNVATFKYCTEHLISKGTKKLRLPQSIPKFMLHTSPPPNYLETPPTTLPRKDSLLPYIKTLPTPLSLEEVISPIHHNHTYKKAYHRPTIK